MTSFVYDAHDFMIKWGHLFTAAQSDEVREDLDNIEYVSFHDGIASQQELVRIAEP